MEVIVKEECQKILLNIFLDFKGCRTILTAQCKITQNHVNVKK